MCTRLPLYLSMISLFMRASNGNGAEKMLVLARDSEALSHKAVGALEELHQTHADTEGGETSDLFLHCVALM